MTRKALAVLRSHLESNVQKLNIPLGNSYTATRRSRRVVWIPIILFLVLITAFCSSYWVFSRQTLTQLVPDNTTAMIRLIPDKQTWPIIMENLRNIPLISGKSLTIKDIANLAEGEVVIFFQNHGQMSVAFQGNRRSFPQDEWDAQGIVVQELAKNRYLLANQITPVSEHKIHRGWSWPNIPYIDRRILLGQVFFMEDKMMKGDIYDTQDGIIITLPKIDLTPLPWKQVPNNSIAILSTPFLTNQLNFPEISSFRVLFEYFDSDSLIFPQTLDKKVKYVLLSEDNQQIGFLMAIEGEGTDFEKYQELLKLSVSLNTPRAEGFQLADGSLAKEMIVDPASVSVEEMVISGTTWSRAGLGGDDYLLAGHDGELTLLSNREDLVRFWLGDRTNELREPPCGAGSGFISLGKLNQLSSNSLFTRGQNLLFPITELFSTLAVENAIFSTNISLCK